MSSYPFKRVKAEEAPGVWVEVAGVGVDQAHLSRCLSVHLVAAFLSGREAQGVVAGAGVVDFVAPGVVVVPRGQGAIGFGEG